MALTAVVVAVAALPLAMASAGPLGAGRLADRVSGRTDDKSVPDDTAREGSARDGGAHDDGMAQEAEPGGEGPVGGPDGAQAPGGGPVTGESPSGARSPELLGLELTTTARCGSELSSPEGIEAQTCVLRQDGETWARAYYRNTTGKELSSVLSMMSPDGRSVRMHCAVGAQDEPGVCETPRQRAEGDPEGYTAVAEFAAVSGGPGAGPSDAVQGPLLLRAGSNSPGAGGG